MLHRTTGTAALAVLATATLVAGVAGPAAAAPTTTTIRQGDLITQLGDTRASGSVEFLREGLRVVTGANTAASGPANNKAAEYFALPGDGLPASGSYDWTGTTAQPGSQIVFDTNGDRTDVNSFNVLVGEQAYSTNPRGGDLTDWWYTGGAERALTRGVICPTTTGGSGSDCHGSLADWAALNPGAQAYAGGFSLGSGVQGEGLLRTLSFGDTTYEFTSVPETPEVVVDDVSPQSGDIRKTKRTVVVTMASETQPPNTEQGQLLTWTVLVDGEEAFTVDQGYDEVDTFRTTFEKNSGRHRIVLLANERRYAATSIVTDRG